MSKKSRLRKAIEAGYAQWQAGSFCKEESCGCVTVYIEKAILDDARLAATLQIESRMTLGAELVKLNRMIDDWNAEKHYAVVYPAKPGRKKKEKRKIPLDTRRQMI